MCVFSCQHVVCVNIDMMSLFHCAQYMNNSGHPETDQQCTGVHVHCMYSMLTFNTMVQMLTVPCVYTLVVFTYGLIAVHCSCVHTCSHTTLHVIVSCFTLCF